MGIEDYPMGRYPRGFIQLGNNFKRGSHDYLTLLFNEGNAAQKVNGDNNHKVKIPLKKVTKYVTEKGKKSEPKKGKKSEKKLKPLIVNARKKKSTRGRKTNKNKKERKKRITSYTTARTKKGRKVASKHRKGKKIGSPRSATDSANQSSGETKPIHNHPTDPNAVATHISTSLNSK